MTRDRSTPLAPARRVPHRPLRGGAGLPVAAVAAALALPGLARGQAASPPVPPASSAAQPIPASAPAPRPLLVRLQDDATYPRPDETPPLGAVDERVLEAGTYRVSWRWVADDGDGPRRGTSRRTSQTVRDSGYATAAVGIQDRTHYFSFDWGATSDLTLGVGLPFRNRSANFERADGTQTRLASNRPGDLEVHARVAPVHEDDEELSFSAAVSAPTGATDRSGDLPEADPAAPNLPYALQPGDGAWALVPGVMWLRWTPEWSFGAHARYAARLIREGSWNRGDEATADLWLARRLDRDTSLSLRLEGRLRRGVQGEDPLVDVAASNLHDPVNSGERRVQVYAGLQYVGTGGHRFAAEVGTPVYQSLSGTQVEQRTSYLLGWSFSF